jgi:hypothetical protein
MSYCRISEGDVYMYHDVMGGIVCCGCRFRGENGSVFFRRSEALAHLEFHIENGDSVPDRAIKRLKEEIAEIGDNVEDEEIYNALLDL